MPAYKNKENGSWYVVTQYTDWAASAARTYSVFRQEDLSKKSIGN